MAIDDRTKWIGGGIFALASAGVAAWWFTRPETPPSTLILRDGAIEVRAYEALPVAQVERSGLREAAVEDGLRELLGQLEGTSIGVLAPVLSDARNGGWRTRVILSRATELPEGEVETLPARRVATLRFSGRADDVAIAKAEARLGEWLEGYGLKVAGPAEIATYTRSGAIAALHRHELWVPVASLY